VPLNSEDIATDDTDSLKVTVGVFLILLAIGMGIGGIYMLATDPGASADPSRSQMNHGVLLLGGFLVTAFIGGAILATPAGPNKDIICPHCNRRGGVTTRAVKRKKGISGAKVTAALFTSGLSIIGTGLSRKEAETEARCRHCGSLWYF